MARRKPQHPRPKSALPPQLAAVTLHAAGIDVGAEAHYVAVPPSDDPQPVRGFGAYTVDLESLADWLAACGITTVALESTGVDWLPLFELLETRGFEGRLVDPPQVQKLTGRPKSDVHDCQWRQRRQTFGLLAGAFRPPDEGCVLRSYLQHSQHRQKARPHMHLKRQPVVSAGTGETGRALRGAMLAGEHAPGTLARLRPYRCHHDEATIAKALHGQWREEHLFALGPAVALDEMDHEKIAACDRRIAAHLETFAACEDREVLPPASRPRQRTRHRPQVDVRGSRPRITGVDLTAMEGIDEPTALPIISAIGLARGRWPTVTQCTSWLGLCPHHRVSGGQV